LNKVIYSIGYWYWQMFVIRYRLSDKFHISAPLHDSQTNGKSFGRRGDISHAAYAVNAWVSRQVPVWYLRSSCWSEPQCTMHNRTLSTIRITHVGLYTRLCLLPHTATVKAGRGLGTRLHALNTYKSFRPNNYIQALLLPCCFLLTTWLVHTSEQVFQQRGQVRWHFKHTR